MPEKYVSLCFLFSFVLLDRLICNFFISYFFRSGRLFFNVIIHFVNYSCTVTKITRTRLNLICEALSAICSTAVLFENISTTIKHTFYMIPGYRSTWLISYTANMAQKLDILIKRLMASAIFHGFFK